MSSTPPLIDGNLTYKTILCNRDHSGYFDGKCNFYHTEKDRRLNYFGQNIPYDKDMAMHVASWIADNEKRYGELNSKISTLYKEIDATQDEINKMLFEAKSYKIWLHLPKV